MAQVFQLHFSPGVGIMINLNNLYYPSTSCKVAEDWPILDTNFESWEHEFSVNGY